MRSRALLCVGVLLLATACPKKSSEHYRKIDIHTHFGPDSARHMLALMDKYGIDMVVNLSGEVPGQGLEENLKMASEHPGRIAIFTNVDWDEAQRGPGYGARLAAELDRAKALGAKGFKIHKGLGLGIRDYRGQLLTVDDPELDVLFERAGQLGLPITIHTGDPVAFWEPPTPANERFEELSVHLGWAVYGRKGVPSWEGLFSQLERRIARNPGTTFISVHFGNAAEYPERVAAMLDKYPNMYVDTAARIPEMGRFNAEKMHEIMTRHADRILFGTDLGVGPAPQNLMLGSTGATPPTQEDTDHFFASTWRYFETWDRTFRHPTPIQGRWPIDGVGLEPEVLRKIYSENAVRLLHLDSATPSAPSSRQAPP